MQQLDFVGFMLFHSQNLPILFSLNCNSNAQRFTKFTNQQYNQCRDFLMAALYERFKSLAIRLILLIRNRNRVDDLYIAVYDRLFGRGEF